MNSVDTGRWCQSRESYKHRLQGPARKLRRAVRGQEVSATVWGRAQHGTEAEACRGCHGDCDEYEANAGSAAHRRKGETAKGKIAEASGAEIVLGYVAGPES